LLVAGPGAHGSELVDLDAALQKFAANSPLFEALFTLATESDSPAPIGQLASMEADLLGVKAITLLAVRPDGYIGLRSDKNHLQALKRYESLILEGTREAALRPSRNDVDWQKGL
jgi:hypothetical protein